MFYYRQEVSSPGQVVVLITITWGCCFDHNHMGKRNSGIQQLTLKKNTTMALPWRSYGVASSSTTRLYRTAVGNKHHKFRPRRRKCMTWRENPSLRRILHIWNEYKMNVETVETEENRTQPWCSYGDVISPQPRPSIEWRLETSKVDV